MTSRSLKPPQRYKIMIQQRNTRFHLGAGTGRFRSGGYLMFCLRSRVTTNVLQRRPGVGRAAGQTEHELLPGVSWFRRPLGVHVSEA